VILKYDAVVSGVEWAGDREKEQQRACKGLQGKKQRVRNAR